MGAKRLVVLLRASHRRHRPWRQSRGAGRRSHGLGRRYRLFVTAGIPSSEAPSGATIEITISNLALGLFFGAGLIASLTAIRSSYYYAVALGAVAALVVAAFVAVWALDKRIDVCVRVGRWVGSPPSASWRRPDRKPRPLHRVSGQSTDPRTAPARGHLCARHRKLGIGCRSAVPDVRRLRLCSTGGHAHRRLRPSAAFSPCCRSLPGGLGLVEGVMVPAFGALGVPAGVALLAVIGWRVLEYLAAHSCVGAGVRLTAVQRGPGERTRRVLPKARQCDLSPYRASQ